MKLFKKRKSFMKKYMKNNLLLCTLLLSFCKSINALATQYISQASVGTTGLTLSQPGVYVLTQDIIFSPAATATAITITTSGVTLDLAGKYIQQGNSTAAVNGLTVTNSLLNIVVKNGTFAKFTSDCVRLLRCSNSITLSNLQCLNSTARYGLLVGPDVLDVSADSLNDIELIDCSCKGNLLGGAFFSAANKVTAYNCKFNDNSNAGLFANNCMDWVLKNCQSNKNTAASLVYGMNAVDCQTFDLENCQFNGNLADQAAGITIEGTSGDWFARNCSFNSNGNLFSSISAASAIGLEVFLTSTAASGGLVFEDCNFNRNIIYGGSASALLVAGVYLSQSFTTGCVFKKCNFIGNKGVSPSSTVFGMATENTGMGNICIDCLAQNNIAANTGEGAGFYVETSIGSQFFNCRSIGNGCLGTGDGIGFDVTVNTTAVVVRNCESYENRGTTVFGFRDANASPTNWYAGNIAFGHGANNYSTIIGKVNVGVAVQPPAASFDERSIDNISII